MKTVLEIFIISLATFNLLLTRFALFGLRQPTTLFMWLIKVFVSAISPILFLIGVLSAMTGWFLNSLPAITIGSLSALFYLIHLFRITRAPGTSTGFEKAFGKEWQNNISPESKSYSLKKRYALLLPHSPDPLFIQNISFHTIPGTDRELLCDLWMPPANVKRSGLTFIYLHGSAWAVLDKDYGTRIFFRHLAAQGHAIMDVAYRLFPETDMMGMMHDAKHAIAWMKENAGSYGVNPDKIVIGGGSAGAHIALLAAYTNKNKQFMPSDLENSDLNVHAVVSLYGQSNLKATYYHTCQHLVKHSGLAQKKPSEEGGMPSWIQKRMGKNFHRLGFDKNVEPGLLSPMLGGNPDEKPDLYALFSPITHVHKDCPPTLILHGEQDILAPLKAIKMLQLRLAEARVPVVMHVIPQTDHAFDLILPTISPSAHNAIYDVERFLAIMAESSYQKKTTIHKMEVVHG